MNSRLSTLRVSRDVVLATWGLTSNSQASIELHIEELVLHGFAPVDRYVIGDVVGRELARLLGQQAVPILLRSESATDEIKGARFNMLPNVKPPTIGRQIAQAVYQGFGE